MLPLAIGLPLLLLLVLALLAWWLRRRFRGSRSVADLESTVSKKSTAPTTALETVESVRIGRWV